MSDKPKNFHGTAIRINNLGLLCVGPSGSGKSELAFSLLAEAERCGASCALIADDQVFLQPSHQTIVALRPPSIAGLIELRGSGIVELPSEESVALTHVVTTEYAKGNERLPPIGEVFQLTQDISLPLVRLPMHSITPFAKFSALVATLCQSGTFDR